MIPAEYRFGIDERSVRFLIWFDRLPKGKAFRCRDVANILRIKDNLIRHYFEHLKDRSEVTKIRENKSSETRIRWLYIKQ